MSTCHFVNQDTQQHGYHIVHPSPWPFFVSSATFFMAVGGVLYMHRYMGGGYLCIFGLWLLLTSVGCWWRDVVREGTLEGKHTGRVQKNLGRGMKLFIVSEVMFFLSFFIAYFYSSLIPTPAIGGVWPPAQMTVIGPWGLACANTGLLIASGCTVTWAHWRLKCCLDVNKSVISWYEEFKKKNDIDFKIGMTNTLILASVFLSLQAVEYLYAPFGISDSVYGSLFFLLTGFHGLHVMIGTVFLIISFYRYCAGHFQLDEHLGFRFAIWYWHFVDVVWILLWLIVYLWGT